MLNAFINLLKALAYLVAAVLIIRYIHPIDYLVSTIADNAYHIFSSENLGWAIDAHEWGNDNASFAVEILFVVVIALLLSLLVNFLIGKIKGVSRGNL